MKPVVKYQGGKSRELPLIQPYITSAKRIIEPFCGGAAVSFHANVSSILNDCNKNVINLYNIIRDKSYFNILLKDVEYIKTLQHDDLEKRYYDARDIINEDDPEPYDLAISYIIVRQLCFSGIFVFLQPVPACADGFVIMYSVASRRMGFLWRTTPRRAGV